MTQITAELVKELREKSGAGMMDCKKALAEVGGNIEEAIDYLRKKGLASAAKKAGRAAAEGLVGIHSTGTTAALVEINAETDFIAKNADFQELVRQATKAAAENDHNVESLAAAPFHGESKTIAEELTRLIATIGENMQLRRIVRLSVDKGHISGYVHTATAPGLGRIGVLVALESEADSQKLDEIGKKIAMHVAATKPIALHRDTVSPKTVEKEREILTEQARQTGKPEEMIAKMVEGRINKFYEEFVLLEQKFVMDPSLKISAYIENEAKNLGQAIVLKDFKMFILGEGVEKKEDNFAAEVAAMSKGA